MVLMGTWYGLSANDINFGTFLFSRQMHDLTFQIYAQTLGVEVSELPGLLFNALIFDSLLIAAIVAYRKRAVLMPHVYKFTAYLAHQFEVHIAGPLRLAELSPPQFGLRFGSALPATNLPPALPDLQQESSAAHPTALSEEQQSHQGS